MPLSKGNGFSGLHISNKSHIPLFLSWLAQGRLLNNQFVQAMQNVALFVGILLTLLEAAPRPDSQIMAKALTRIIRTKARDRLFRSSEGRLILPLL